MLEEAERPEARRAECKEWQARQLQLREARSGQAARDSATAEAQNTASLEARRSAMETRLRYELRNELRGGMFEEMRLLKEARQQDADLISSLQDEVGRLRPQLQAHSICTSDDEHDFEAAFDQCASK